MKKLLLLIVVALILASCSTTYWERVNTIIEEDGGLQYYGK